MIILRALGALLCYPCEDVRQALPEIADAIRTSPLIAPRQRADLLALIDDIGGGDHLEAEERYVELFDRGRAVSLHLFEHLHGEGRDRGQAMVDLKNLYERAGFDLSARELLSDCAHILRRIGQSLIARGSHYAAVLQALLVLAGEAAIDVAVVPRVMERAENLDRDWFEQPAFGVEPLASATGLPPVGKMQPRR